MAAGHDGGAEGGLTVGVDVYVDGEGAGGFAPDGYARGIAGKGGGVALDPGQGEALVVEA